MNFFRLHVCENDGLRIDSPGLFPLMESGISFDWPYGEELAVQQGGTAYDWIGGWSWAPYVQEHVYNRLRADLAEDSINWHGPFAVNHATYYLMNCVRVLDCALPGSNDNILRLDFDVIGNSQMFRPSYNTRQIIVSALLRNSIVCAKDSGVRFGLIQSDGWEAFPFSRRQP